MKKMSVLLALTLALGLTACGGGGGSSSSPGGGGSDISSGAGSNTFLPADIAKLPLVTGKVSIFEDLPDSTELRNSSRGVYIVQKTATGIEVSENNPGGDFADRTQTLPFSDFRNHGDYVVGGISTGTLPLNLTEDGNHWVGEAVLHDAVYLGGQKLGLKYSEFGIWTVMMGFEGTLNGNKKTFLEYDDVHSLTYVTTGKEANFVTTPGTDGVFKGNTIATVFESAATAAGQNKAYLVTGEATLTVDAANLQSGANVILDYKDFYKFTFNNIGDLSFHGGRFDQDIGAGSYTVSGNGGSTGINFDNTMQGDMKGAFAGETPGNPTEAVGRFSLQSPAEDKWIEGAFGARKQ